MNRFTALGDRMVIAFQTAWHRLKEDERGEGLVTFLIIAVAVAVLALFVVGVFETEVEGGVGDFDMGDAPSPEDPVEGRGE